MARYPGAAWKPLGPDWASQPRMRAFDIVCIHTMVGGLEGTDAQFRVTNGPGFSGLESHFGTDANGRVYQWQDTDYQAEANGNGNWHIISIENADWGAPFPTWGGSDVPAFTDAQIEAIAQICAWAHLTHGIPLELIPDSKPGRRGIAPHRWGVPGFVVAGGELWSTVNRKACPGDRRIAQLPQIIARAIQIVNGEDDMPLTQTDLDNIAAAVRDQVLYVRDASADGGNRNLGDKLNQIILSEAAQSAQLAVLLKSGAVPFDPAVFIAAVKPMLGEAVAAGLAADDGAQADEIVDKLAARLARASIT